MRKILLILYLMWSSLIIAQNINVTSFKLLENDLTANTTGTIERDQNGEPAALIKVVTTQQGFVFDGGMVGVVKTKQGVGEVWVYVPHGIKKITIQHPQLGVLRDYYFPLAVDKAKTYEMVLSTGKVETFVTHTVNKQFMVFSVKPTNAMVELEDEMLTVDSEGYATKSVSYGTYNYRVSCANYHTEAGQVTVNADGKVEVNVTLRPNFGWIEFVGDSELNGADIYIGSERVGKLPLVSNILKSGVHRVKIVKNMYKTYEQEVTVQDDDTTELNVKMIPNFATVTLTTDDESEIWIDGEKRNKGKWSGALELGNYTVEVKRESHRTISEVLRIDSIGEYAYELKSPTPIYGTLEISSTPLRALVSIDGVKVGETPLIKNNVLVGTRHVRFEKDGYGAVDKTVEVNEDGENLITAELSMNMKEVTITSSPSGATVYVDGSNKGNTPLKLTLSIGSHSVALDKKGYKAYRESVTVFATDANEFHVNLDENGKGRGTKLSMNDEFNSKNVRIGLDMGISTYGINYGGELGVVFKNYSLSMGVNSYVMGQYAIKSGRNEDNHTIQLLRFFTKFGYTYALNDFGITPQVGVVYGPSFLTGKKYIMQEYAPGILVNRDYGEMNREIVKFAKIRCGFVIGARFEYLFSDYRFGVHATPEYIIKEGVLVNAGVSIRF